jgi:hypothetical protein
MFSVIFLVFSPSAFVLRAFCPDFITAEDLSDGCGSKIDIVVVSSKFEGAITGYTVNI